MRTFAAQDGAIWSVRLDEGQTRALHRPAKAGWEALLFETAGTQKVAFRPVGWLTQASLADLNQALREAETVRTRWESPPIV